MSHFVALVMVPKRDFTEGMVDKILDPFSEHREVEEHEVACGCIGSSARIAAREAADAMCGTLDKLRKDFSLRPDVQLLNKKFKDAVGKDSKEVKRLDDRLSGLWARFTEKWQKTRERAEKINPMFEKTRSELR